MTSLFDEEYFHDRASSLRFMGSYDDGRYTATLYRDMNYGGASMAFGADDPWLGDDAIGSDQADAIRIRAVPACTGDGVYLYEGANYTGRCRNFTASEPYLDTVVVRGHRIVGPAGRELCRRRHQGDTVRGRPLWRRAACSRGTMPSWGRRRRLRLRGT